MSKNLKLKKVNKKFRTWTNFVYFGIPYIHFTYSYHGPILMLHTVKYLFFRQACCWSSLICLNAILIFAFLLVMRSGSYVITLNAVVSGSVEDLLSYREVSSIEDLIKSVCEGKLSVTKLFDSNQPLISKAINFVVWKQLR